MSSISVKSRAFGLNIEDIDIVVVDDNPGMVKILMTILSAFKVKRARYYTSAEQALTEMIAEPPHIVITDWLMNPIDGLDMLQTMRNKAMHPLCNTAIIVLTGEPSRKNMASALDNAATYFMVKPISPHTLLEKLKWVCKDGRNYEFNGDQMAITGKKAEIRSQPKESALPEPMIIDYVKAEQEGTAPVLCMANEDLFATDQHKIQEFLLNDLEDEEEMGTPEESGVNFQKKTSQQDDETDWLDSNFSWAF